MTQETKQIKTTQKWQQGEKGILLKTVRDHRRTEWNLVTKPPTKYSYKSRDFEPVINGCVPTKKSYESVDTTAYGWWTVTDIEHDGIVYTITVTPTQTN